MTGRSVPSSAEGVNSQGLGIVPDRSTEAQTAPDLLTKQETVILLNVQVSFPFL